MNLSKSKYLFIDFDGVIVDSNFFKEKAIEMAIINLFGNNLNSRKAINYFNEFAGIGREKKLSVFFDAAEIEKILNVYNQNCISFLSNVSPTVGFIKFIETIKKKFKKTKVHILSGGEYSEIEYFLNKNKIIHFFDGILASEDSKISHLSKKNVTINDVFIGDSKSDLKTAIKANIQFVLMEEFRSEKSFPDICNQTNLYIHQTKNFNSLVELLRYD